MAETNFLLDEDQDNGNSSDSSNQGESDFDDLEITEEEENEDSEKDSDTISISKSKLSIIKKLLLNIKESNDKLLEILPATSGMEERITIGQISDSTFTPMADVNAEDGDGKIVEGVFDGENMIGQDGKQYSVPANYASKSKLVEGDILKLTITPNGTFVYKQIGPIERKRVVGDLEQLSNGNFIVKSEGKTYKVLVASVTYYKGQDGDQVVLLVPKGGDSKWGSIDNIVKE